MEDIGAMVDWVGKGDGGHDWSGNGQTVAVQYLPK
jgi:hypothetical protein